MKIATGTEDGITYEVKLSQDAEWWEVWAGRGTMVLQEKYKVGYPPRFGPDVADVAEGERVLDRVLTKLKASP